jgi:hypothetical protein
MGPLARHCKQCGRGFTAYSKRIAAGGGKYCSMKCKAQAQRKGEWRTCVVCSARFYISAADLARRRGRYCSPSCSMTSRSGSLHHNWNSGRIENSEGYVLLRSGKGKYRREHVVIMEEHIGRPLNPDECVHHRNGIRDDNRLSNLELLTRTSHIKKYHPKAKNPANWIEVVCTHCGIRFERYHRRYKKTANMFCSSKCYHDWRWNRT